STRNTRIERLWVEVGTQFARRWRGFFTRLGRSHRLDRKNPGHLWLLHRLFLPSINEDCAEFQDEWNLHPISGRMPSDQSPADMRFLGQTTEGLYRQDPLDGIHPDAINRYYGVSGPRRRRHRHQTGAGYPSDEEESEAESMDAAYQPDLREQLENHIEAHHAENIRHNPVKVARHKSPFTSTEHEAAFLEVLHELLASPGDPPEDYGVLEDEWEEDDYPEIEAIRTGTNGKEILVVLPRRDWFPRVVQWARALDLMTRILQEVEEFASGSEGSENGDE
ncbi:hypothetical protein C8J57DRAFT_1072144, partial [Mycena rebaudengoi]